MKCKYCLSNINDGARVCPHCRSSQCYIGYVNQHYATLIAILVSIAGVSIAVMTFNSAHNEMKIAKASYEEIKEVEKSVYLITRYQLQMRNIPPGDMLDAYNFEIEQELIKVSKFVDFNGDLNRQFNEKYKKIESLYSN